LFNDNIFIQKTTNGAIFEQWINFEDNSCYFYTSATSQSSIFIVSNSIYPLKEATAQKPNGRIQ